MALEFSSAGVTLSYCVELTAGSFPSAGSFISIPSIKSVPDINAEPSALDVTDLSDKVFKRAIPGLKDVGGALGFTANLTASFVSAWTSCVSAASTGLASGKSTWWQVKIPNFQSFFFAGTPSELGLKGLDVDSVAECDAYITPNQIKGWATSI